MEILCLSAPVPKPDHEPGSYLSLRVKLLNSICQSSSGVTCSFPASHSPKTHKDLRVQQPLSRRKLGRRETESEALLGVGNLCTLSKSLYLHLFPPMSLVSLPHSHHPQSHLSFLSHSSPKLVTSQQKEYKGRLLVNIINNLLRLSH